MPHEPIYLSEEQLAEIANLEFGIEEIEQGTWHDAAKLAAIAALEEEIGEIQEAAPAGTPKKACLTCPVRTHCPTCNNPIDSDGFTTADGGVAYLADEEVPDVE